MQIITDYTREAYRPINRNLLQGIATEQAKTLFNAVAALPMMPGTSYRTFTVDNIEQYVEQIKRSPVLTFAAFSSASRLQPVALKFGGNVRLTIEGKTGRDIAVYSDAPREAETLFLPALNLRIRRLKTVKVAGQIVAVEIEANEV
ncbi:hypothetical protein J2I47_14980 [Fibrella sp. HMF5335]|uniref:NAD(+)--protein-arginine ADP-ribosyltransferase n=1 Tax=Fibrella rubiginis TaxID=2817060 RepID=A0A939GJD5_9BACT|nr:hypothetical protein [Fibrella rubiginis]MBO0937860.1 hypothetical protein [Fibrella rubiginis]